MPLTKRGGWPYANPPNTQFTLNTQSPQSRGLVGWWPMLGSVGGVVRDRVANRFPMALNNGPLRVTDGVMGHAMLYDDAASQYLSSAAPLAAAPLTMSAWFYCDDGAQVGTAVTLLNAGDTDRHFRLWLPGTLGQTFYVQTRDAAAPGSAIATKSWVAGQWHLGVGVFESSSSRIAYLDGAHAGTDATNVTPAGIDTAYIGLGRANYMSGRIADARLYNRALSAAEVWAMYDPATRWELYKPVIPSGVVFVSALKIPLFMHHYRQLRIGNGF